MDNQIINLMNKDFSNLQHKKSIKSLPVYSKLFGNIRLTAFLYDECCHLKMMYRWTKMPYANKFWSVHLSFKKFQEMYANMIIDNEVAVVLFSVEDALVAQVEVYQANKSELSEFLECSKDDYGIHILMAPFRELLGKIGEKTKGLSGKVLQTILEMLFYVSDASKVYAEPDIRNIHSCKLAEKIGFSFLKEIQMSDKKANLYVMTKKDYCQKYSPPVWQTPNKA